jgi:bifunctional UDP-N-acetylglucosamine pyrophosphorylase/glucosamine-1-phosphate N-acetyltransferase
MTACIILAAGQGKRMRSALPKVVHPVLGVPMVLRVVRQARKAGADDPVVVVGHGRDEVIPLLESESVSWEIQEKQLGTAHAVMCGMRGIRADSVTVLLGDVPLLESGTISMLEDSRRESGAAMAVLTTCPPDPSGYGRVIRDGRFLREIVEDRDCTPDQLSIGEINTGLMSFDGALLPSLLEAIDTDNDQSEYYLTDAVSVAAEKGLACAAVQAPDHREVSGVNDRVQLALATEYLRNRVLERHLLEGVGIPDPGTVWVEESVEIGSGVTLGRCVRLSGRTSVGDGSVIGDGCVIVDSRVPAGSRLEPYTVLGWKGVP